MTNCTEKSTQKNRRLFIFGIFLLLLSLGGGLFAYASHGEIFGQYYSLNDQEREGFYMMSGVFSVMSLFCLNAAWQRKTTFHL